MATCEEIEPLAAAYIDGEGTDAERAAVAAHLDACAPCRQQMDRQVVARDVIRSCRQSLLSRTSGAPSALRARCRYAPVAPRRHVLPLAAAASILLASTVLLIGLTSRSATVLAAQLTIDHVKCFEFVGKPVPDAHALEAKLAPTFGPHFIVPPGFAAAGLTLLTARRCLYADGKVAHVMYRHHDRPVSLFVLPETDARRDTREEVKVMGHEAVLWSQDGRSYVLVGREPRAELEQLAAYVQKTVAR